MTNFDRFLDCVLETRHDLTETPNTGGSAASSCPAIPVDTGVSQASNTSPMMTSEELAQAQELLKAVSDELADLNYRMGHAVEFTQQDMERMQVLQPIAFECRQKVGLG